MRVLLIEDDLLLGETLEDYLEENGINVVWLYDDRYVEDTLELNEFDVVILDLILKYRRGEDILKLIREKNFDTPVLILTAKNSIHDKEVCFSLGADDYLTKPFSPKELLLRVKALSKRKRLNDSIKIGDITIDIEKGVIKKAGREVKLSKKAWELLSFLVKNRGSVVPSERIIKYVWGDKPVGDEVLRAYIKELRKILPSGAIETYKGRGYKLN